MKKKGTIAKPKTRFHIWGSIANSNITFNEFICAYSEAQAKLILHRRLQARHPRMVVFLDYRGCKAAAIRPKLSGMIPENDSSYPCSEGCGGEPEFIPPTGKSQKPKPIRRSVRSANLSLF